MIKLKILNDIAKKLLENLNNQDGLHQKVIDFSYQGSTYRCVPMLPFNDANQCEYAIISENRKNLIGRGNFGKVYKTDVKLLFTRNEEHGLFTKAKKINEPLVVKVSADNSAETIFYQTREQHFNRRLGDENASLLSLDQQCYGYGTQTRFPGQSIESAQALLADLSLDKRLLIIRNFIKELEKLAEHNIIHLDLKPENVMINFANLKVKIIDLGFAHTVAEAKSHTRQIYENPFEICADLDHRGRPVQLGTEHFMSPEVYLKKKDSWRKRTDMFSATAIILSILGIPENFYLKDRIKQRGSEQIDFAKTRFSLMHLTYYSDIPSTIKDSLISLLDKMMSFNIKDRPKIRNEEATLLQQFDQIITQWLLENKLKPYIKKRKNQFNFFNRDNNPEPGRSKTEKLEAAKHLKNQLENNELLDPKPHLVALKDGELGKIYELASRFKV